ncbi:hypothetical protein, partial [Pseudomonas qingdaonensis]|uniref:hypothetical protein n=1 Tax=Pseudomonas qingdaonensis TaxID=2056231 RepID=UPI001F1AC39C
RRATLPDFLVHGPREFEAFFLQAMFFFDTSVDISREPKCAAKIVRHFLHCWHPRPRADPHDNPQKLWITRWTTPSYTPQTPVEWGPRSN